MRGCLWGIGIVFVFLLIGAIAGNNSSSGSGSYRAPPSAAESRRLAVETGLRWSSYRSTSRIDDSPSVYLSLRAVELATNEYGRRIQPVLNIRCLENTTSLFVEVPQTYLGLDDIRVTYRIDDAPARTASWRISTDRHSMGLWRGNQSIPLVRQLADANLLTLRFTPYGEVPFLTTFMVEGLDEELPPLREACHW